MESHRLTAPPRPEGMGKNYAITRLAIRPRSNDPEFDLAS
jgi:hypothetical protein